MHFSISDDAGSFQENSGAWKESSQLELRCWSSWLHETRHPNPRDGHGSRFPCMEQLLDQELEIGQVHIQASWLSLGYMPGMQMGDNSLDVHHKGSFPHRDC